MGISEIVLYIIVGVGAGVLSGMFGIGGGILIVPALVLITGMSLKEAYGTSLAALLLPVGILGCIVYYREKLLRVKAALAVAVGIICTIGLGAYAANRLDPRLLRICYSLFLLYIGLKFIKPVKLWRSLTRSPNTNSEVENKDTTASSPTLEPQRPSGIGFYGRCLVIGLIAGVIAGFFGVGGGAIIVPLLCLWLRFDTKEAIATSLGVLLPPIGLPGVLVYYAAGNFELMTAIYVSSGLLLGTIFGARLTVRLPLKIIRAAYGVLLICTGIKFSLRVFEY